MDELALLKPKLTRLKLSGVLETLADRMQRAMSEKWPYSQFLDVLVSDEVERRDHKQLARRLSKSGLDVQKTLESFDFTFNPRIHEPTVRELATCSFVSRKENVFFAGPSGVGKSHLAQALGHEAARRGHEVLFRRTATLLQWIAAGRGDGSFERRLRAVSTLPLLILDDFGLTPYSEEQQADLYELICERYEKSSTVVTSNRLCGAPHKRFNAESSIMRSPFVRDPACRLNRGGSTPHNGSRTQRGNQFVRRLESARSQFRRDHRFQGFQLH